MEFSPVTITPEARDHLLQRDAWATYFVGKYYFTVNTGKRLEAYGLKPGSNIGVETQRRLQYDHIVALYHEYIHYIHEVSTVMGHIGLNLDLAMKSVFTHYFDPILASCLHQGIDLHDTIRFDHYQKYYASKHILLGAVEQDLKMVRITDITYTQQPVYIPAEFGPYLHTIEVAEIAADAYIDHRLQNRKYVFGKFFLYEGLAYELDRELDRQVRQAAAIDDTARLSEYTVLRLIAKFIWPDVTRRVYLTIASLALSYLDAGQQFLTLLKEVKQGVDNGQPVDTVLEAVRRREGGMLLEKLPHFNDDEIVGIFRQRPQLERAFGVILAEARSGHIQRANWPAFEVDLIFDDRYTELLDRLPICDYMYVFRDPDPLHRDFLGTTFLNDEDSGACKALRKDPFYAIHRRC